MIVDVSRKGNISVEKTAKGAIVKIDWVSLEITHEQRKSLIEGLRHGCDCRLVTPDGALELTDVGIEICGIKAILSTPKKERILEGLQ